MNDLTGRAVSAALLTVAIIVAIAVGLLADINFARADSSKWTGCYVGAGGAYSMAAVDTSAAYKGATQLDVNGLSLQGVGLYGKVGCDVELVPHIVIGAFGTYDWYSNADFSVSVPAGDVVKASLDKGWTIGGRAGYLVTRETLVYALAGYTQAEMSDITSPLGGFKPISTPTLKGYVLGGGVDIALQKGWFLQAEYTFAQYDKVNIPLSTNWSLGLEPDVQTVRAGLAYKFDWSGEYLPALPVEDNKPHKPLK